MYGLDVLVGLAIRLIGHPQGGVTLGPLAANVDGCTDLKGFKVLV